MVVPMHVLLVEPDYYTRYPPVGLLKLATYHKMHGDTVELVKGTNRPIRSPDLIYVTSLFTYAWRPVHESVRFFKATFPSARLILGGIYASLLPKHAKKSGADEVHVGLFKDAEGLRPDYSLVPQWNGSIVFASRGCTHRCPFCAVPRLEGELNSIKYTIRHLIYPTHNRVIVWDNNILAAPSWDQIVKELQDFDLTVDFNQGLDARLVTTTVARQICLLKTDVIRLSYDYEAMTDNVKRTIELLSESGIRRRKVVVYTLFNYTDSPEDFFTRVRNLLRWGVVCYPMRFEPLDSLSKNQYVGPKWTNEMIEMVTDARRVLGTNGAFPPYDGLVKKFERASCFGEAFELRPPQRKKLRTPKSPHFAQELLAVAPCVRNRRGYIP